MSTSERGLLLPLLLLAGVAAAIAVAAAMIVFTPSGRPDTRARRGSSEPAPVVRNLPTVRNDETDSTPARRVRDTAPDAPPAETLVEEPDSRRPANCTCRGRLTFDDGSPVADEPVWLALFPRESARTGRDGRFVLAVAPDTACETGLMLGEEEGAFAAGQVSLAPGEIVEVEFTIPRGVTLEITVAKERSGDAVMNTLVRLEPEWPEGRAVRGLTDGRGRTVLRHAPRAPYLLSIDRSDLRPVRKPIDLRFAADVERFRIEMQELGRLAVRVDGWPEGRVSSVTVRFSTADGGLETVSGSLGPDGRAALVAPPAGSYETVEVECDAWAVALPGLDVPEAESIEIRLTVPGGARVSGRIADGASETIASPGVVTITSARGWDLGAPERRAQGPVRADGTFEVEAAPAGAVIFTVTLGRQTVPIIAGGNIDVPPEGLDAHVIRLAGARVEGRVTGEPMPDDQVSVVPSYGISEVVQSARLDPSTGSFAFPWLSPGLYRFELAASQGSYSESISAEVPVSGDEAVFVVLERRTAPEVAFVFRDVDGRPVTGERLILFRPAEAARLREAFSMRFDLDRAGRAACRRLRPGRWFLFSESVSLGTIDVTEGETPPITLVLPR